VSPPSTDGASKNMQAQVLYRYWIGTLIRMVVVMTYLPYLTAG